MSDRQLVTDAVFVSLQSGRARYVEHLERHGPTSCLVYITPDVASLNVRDISARVCDSGHSFNRMHWRWENKNNGQTGSVMERENSNPSPSIAAEWKIMLDTCTSATCQKYTYSVVRCYTN